MILIKINLYSNVLINSYIFLLRKCIGFREKQITCMLGNCKRFNSSHNVPRLNNKALERYFRKAKSDYFGCYSYVIDDNVAEEIGNLVIQLAKNKEHVNIFEINPGIGKITGYLLRNGIKKISLSDALQGSLCRTVCDDYKNNIEMLNYNNSKLILNNISDAFPAEFNIDKAGPSIIIAVNVCRRFIRHIIKRIMLQDKTFLYNSELIILMSEEIYIALYDLSYKMSKVQDFGCMDVLFNVDVLASFQRMAILPPTSSDFKNMFLIRLQRNKNISFSCYHYWIFLTILEGKKLDFVIAALEKYMPNCGPYLIANGFSVSTQVYELTRNDLWNLFKLLQELDAFEDVMALFEVEKNIDE